MPAQILDGKKLALEIQTKLKTEIIQGDLVNKITLAVIMVGNDPASEIYVANKTTACEFVGIRVSNYYLKSNVTKEELAALIHQLNNEPKVHGILLQLPLPNNLTYNLVQKISPLKDVDGFNPYNLGRLAQKSPCIRSCTPKGIIKLLEYYKIPIKSKNITIVGASNIVGRPLALEMLNAGGTVTMCHKLTGNLKEHCINADILCSAAGHPDLIKSHYIKPGATVIDVGITRAEDGTILGDVEFAEVAKVAKYITPVPGGVGPMTVAMLLENTLQCYQYFNLQLSNN